MYRASIAARARRGAYIGDYRSCAKLFEMYTADVLSQLHGVKFVLWEDLDPAIKEARGMPPKSSRLYEWARYQLTHRATLSVEHIEQLQALGFWRWPYEPR